MAGAEPTRLRHEHKALSKAEFPPAETVSDQNVTQARREETELLRLQDRTERLSRKLRKAHADVKWFRNRYLTAQVADLFARRICRLRVLLGLARRSALGRDAETREILAAVFSAQGEGLSLPPRVLAWLSRPRTLFGLLRRYVLAGRASAEGVLASALRARLDAGGAIPREQPVPPDSEPALARARRRLVKVADQLAAEQRRAGEIARKLTAVEHAMVAEERALYDAQIELTKLRWGARVDGATLGRPGGWRYAQSMSLSANAAVTSQLESLPTHSPQRNTRGRVILVTPDIVGPVKNGGIGTACFHYARSLANAGYHVEVLFSGTVGDVDRQRWVKWYDSLGVGFYTMDEIPSIGITLYGSRWHIERAQYILQYLRERQYDYIIFQDWHANGFWTARAKQMGMAFGNTPIGLIAHSPTQWQKQGMQTFGSPVEDCSVEWAEKETIAAVDVLISPSHHMVDWLRGHGYRLPERVVICPYTFEDETLEAAADVDIGHLIFFGRLETRKGLHLLGGALRELQALGCVLPRKVSWLGKLAEVNGIPTMDYLRALEKDLGTVEFVVKTDFDYAQAVEYIRSQNGIVVIPSTLDNYPLTVVESIANSFRFIASDAGGIPEMIDPAVCFERTVSGLREKLEGLSAIDFAGLRHAYDPEDARQIWLEHVETTAAKARLVPQARRSLRKPVPPVSVCIPFYRHDQYIDRLVYSFLRMDLPELQLVFVNDGTPPEERKRFDRLRRELEPLGHVFHDQVNAGPGVARNKAVELARHDLLLFFDADNVPFPNMVERLSDALMSGAADSLAAPFVGVPPMLRLPVSEDAVMQYRPPGGPVALALVDNVVGDVCSLVRRHVVEAVGGFTEQRQTWEDLDFFLRAIARGFRHMVYPDPLFFYTVDEQGRNLTAATHMNYRNLLRCLHSMPAEVTSEVAEIFAAQFLVSKRRQRVRAPQL